MTVVIPFEQRLAYHEAGHAVVAHYKHFEILYLTIDHDKFFSGECKVQPCVSIFAELNRVGYLKDLLVCYSAGNEALQCLYDKAAADLDATDENISAIQKSIDELDGTDEKSVAANSDYENIRGIIIELPKLGCDPKEYVPTAVEECKSLIAQHWNEVEDLARELLVKRTLDWTEVKKILNRRRTG